VEQPLPACREAGVVCFLRIVELGAMEHGTNVSVVAGKALAATFSTKITLKNPVSGCYKNLSDLAIQFSAPSSISALRLSRTLSQ